MTCKSIQQTVCRSYRMTRSRILSKDKTKRCVYSSSSASSSDSASDSSSSSSDSSAWVSKVEVAIRSKSRLKKTASDCVTRTGMQCQLTVRQQRFVDLRPGPSPRHRSSPKTGRRIAGHRSRRPCGAKVGFLVGSYHRRAWPMHRYRRAFASRCVGRWRLNKVCKYGKTKAGESHAYRLGRSTSPGRKGPIPWRNRSSRCRPSWGSANDSMSTRGRTRMQNETTHLELTGSLQVTGVSGNESLSSADRIHNQVRKVSLGTQVNEGGRDREV